MSETSGPVKVFFCYSTPTVIMLVATILMVYTIVSSDDRKSLIPEVPGVDVGNIDVGGWTDNLPVGQQEDPFKGVNQGGVNTGDAIKWNNGPDQTGLQLEVYNALDSSWTSHFEEAIADWDFGSPDALEIRIVNVPIDPDCNSVPYKMVVCNNDFGDTRWRGINSVLVDQGYITASVAKMNEYYLKEAIDAQRQYTMCHEIGHGFGLAHTDEDPDNEDLGNCLDYTRNPEVNKNPDRSNYETLAALYGEIPVSRQRRLVSNVVEDETLPEWAFLAWKEALEEVEFFDARSNFELFEQKGWTLLDDRSYARDMQKDLGNGISVQVFMLFADD